MSTCPKPNDRRPPWPVMLLTGALGSGKTTLLRHVLQDPALKGTLVVVNELGDIGLDHQLVERIDEEVILLRSGCLCCSMRLSLASTLQDVHRRWMSGAIEHLHRVVIETTGMRRPGPVLATLATHPLTSNVFQVASVVTTVDAEHGARQLQDRPEVAEQIAVADLLLLTKTDRIVASELTAWPARLRQRNPYAEHVAVVRGRIDAQRLLRASPLDPKRGTRMSVAGSPAGPARATSMWSGPPRPSACRLRRRSTGTTSWPGSAASSTGTGTVPRVKAILDVAGCDLPVVVHGVHRTFYEPATLACWPAGEHRSRVVIIHDGLPAEAIAELRAASWATPPAMKCSRQWPS